jgi:hypothetical protein
MALLHRDIEEIHRLCTEFVASSSPAERRAIEYRLAGLATPETLGSMADALLEAPPPAPSAHQLAEKVRGFGEHYAGVMAGFAGQIEQLAEMIAMDMTSSMLASPTHGYIDEPEPEPEPEPPDDDEPDEPEPDEVTPGVYPDEVPDVGVDTSTGDAPAGATV